MTARVAASEFTALGLDDWRVIRSGVEANFACVSFAEAGRFAADLAALCDERDHHASIDLRYPDLVHVMSTTHFMNALTDRDVALAAAISDLARTRGYRSTPRDSMVVEIAIDAADIEAVRPFWQAVLGYVPEHTLEGEVVDAIIDPEGLGPSVWFQRMEEPRVERNRIHLDVNVPADVAQERVAAAVAAGGRLVSDAENKAFWVLADPEGNEACVCPWQTVTEQHE
jgi:4a-hydroxytetrahydrobiopterin dehydratase